MTIYRLARPPGDQTADMPLPPVDLTATHVSVGVRAQDFARISPLFKFWPAGAMMCLQTALVSGNLLARHLSDT